MLMSYYSDATCCNSKLGLVVWATAHVVLFEFVLTQINLTARTVRSMWLIAEDKCYHTQAIHAACDQV